MTTSRLGAHIRICPIAISGDCKKTDSAATMPPEGDSCASSRNPSNSCEFHRIGLGPNRTWGVNDEVRALRCDLDDIPFDDRLGHRGRGTSAAGCHQVGWHYHPSPAVLAPQPPYRP